MASASRAGDDDGDGHEWKKKLSVGVSFRPSDEVLVVFYLKAKVDQAAIRPGIIKEINLYEYEPWVLRDLAFHHGDGNLYFFTKLHKKYEKGTRAKRTTAQGGVWKATQAREDVKSKNGEIVGTKTPLAYYVINKETGNPVKTQWLMNEFRMPKEDTASASQQTQVPRKSEEWALCVVHYHNKDANGSNSDDGQRLIPERVEEDHPSPCTKRRRTTGAVVIRDPMPSTSLNPPNPCNVTSPTMHIIPEHNHSQKTQNPNSYSNLSVSTGTFNSTLGIDPILGHHFPTPNLHSSNLSQISNINPPRQQYHQPPPQQAILQNHVYSFGPSPSIKRMRVNGVAIQDPMPTTSSNPNPCNATIPTMHIIEHYHRPNPNRSANLGPSTVTLNSTLGVDHPILSQNRYHFLRTNLQSSNLSQISQIDRGLSHTPVQTTYQAISSSSSITNRDNNLGLNHTPDRATSVPQRVTSFDLLLPNPHAMLRPILDMIQIPSASLDTSTTPEHQPNQCTLHGNGDDSDDWLIG